MTNQELDQFDEQWLVLLNTINETLENPRIDIQLNKIQDACTNLVNNGQSDLISNRFSDILKAHFKYWHQQLSSADGDPLIMKLYDQYQDYKDYCAIFPKYCMLYDLHFQEEEPKKTVNLIRNLFIQNILSDHQLFEYRVTPSIVKVIRCAQNGLEIDLTEVSAVIEMYHSFRSENDFSRIFENLQSRLRDEEGDVYSNFYKNNFAAYYFNEYLSFVEQQYDRDKSIFEQFFSPEETADILNHWDSILLNTEGRELTVIAKEEIMKNFFSNNITQVKWLIRIYELLNVYPECEEEIMPLIIEKIQAIEKPRTDKFEEISQFIDEIYDISNLYCDLFTSRAANEHLEESIKEELNKVDDICEKLNIYIDCLVRNEFRGYQAEEQSKHIILIYKYLEDKPTFENSYENYFIRRLCKMKQTLFKFENTLIDAIRSVNRDFMTRYEKIKAQTEGSEALASEFNKQLENNDRMKQIQFSPLVISQEELPILYDEEFIPLKISALNNSFKSFYESKRRNENLLVSYFSTVDFKLKIENMHGSRAYTITTDLPCACVLSELSLHSAKFSQIISIMNNDRIVASSVIMKLFNLKLVTRKGETNRLSNDDEFSLNKKFVSDTSKIIVPPVSNTEIRDRRRNEEDLRCTELIKRKIFCILVVERRVELPILENRVIYELHDSFFCTHEMFWRVVDSLNMQEIEITHEYGRTFVNLIT